MAKVSPYHTNSTEYPHEHRTVQHDYDDCPDGNPSITQAGQVTSRVAVSASSLPPRSLNSHAWIETFGDPNNFADPLVNRPLICTAAVVCLAWLIWGVSPALATPVAAVNPLAGDGQSAALSAAFAVA